MFNCVTPILNALNNLPDLYQFTRHSKSGTAIDSPIDLPVTIAYSNFICGQHTVKIVRSVFFNPALHIQSGAPKDI